MYFNILSNRITILNYTLKKPKANAFGLTKSILKIKRNNKNIPLISFKIIIFQPNK